MCYLNGKKVLPQQLLTAIQEYIDGEYIYIPRKTDSKRPWGTDTSSKMQTRQRNQEIYSRYNNGTSIGELAAEYFLAPKTVYGIVAKLKS